jgi:mycothiol synthase
MSYQDGHQQVEGLRLRLFEGKADYERMAAVVEGSRVVDGLEEIWTAEDLARFYRQAVNVDPYQDVIIAEILGEVVAYGRTRWWQEANNNRIYSTLGFVLPAWRRKGIGRAILYWNETRLRSIAADHPQDGRRLFQGVAENSAPGAMALLASEGYRPARYFYRMVRPDLENIPNLPLPAGLEVRPARPEHYQQIKEANIEVFQEHWGFSSGNEPTLAQWLENPNFDPTLWQIAWDREEVVGMVLPFIDHRDNEVNGFLRGYTEEIGVRWPWRKRGLARALIAGSLHALRERGMTQAALQVDAENESGALGLYQTMGYQMVQRTVCYRKELESEERRTNKTLYAPLLSLQEATMSNQNGKEQIAGMCLRLFNSEADYERIAAVLEGSRVEDGGEETTSAEDIARVYRHMNNIDPYQDVIMAEVNGEVVGYGRTRWWDEANNNRVYSTFGSVHPQWRRKGIGRAILHWNEARLRSIAATHPQDSPHLLESGVENSVPGAMALLESEGYRPVRYFYLMVRPDLENIPDLPLPDGLEVRPARPEHYQQILDANIEAFEDHWGMDLTNIPTLAQWMEQPDFQPALWQIAWDGEKVAGMVLPYIDRRDNEANGILRGYTEEICVRRPWRKRGLARTLIARSLHALREQGMNEAALHVDADNETGALRLYKTMGYQVVNRSVNYRKEM